MGFWKYYTMDEEIIVFFKGKLNHVGFLHFLPNFGEYLVLLQKPTPEFWIPDPSPSLVWSEKKCLMKSFIFIFFRKAGSIYTIYFVCMYIDR